MRQLLPPFEVAGTRLPASTRVSSLQGRQPDHVVLCPPGLLGRGRFSRLRTCSWIMVNSASAAISAASRSVSPICMKNEHLTEGVNYSPCGLNVCVTSINVRKDVDRGKIR